MELRQMSGQHSAATEQVWCGIGQDSNRVQRCMEYKVKRQAKDNVKGDGRHYYFATSCSFCLTKLLSSYYCRLFYMIWQMMVALLHSSGQLRTERDGDTERGCQKPAVQKKTTDDSKIG